MDSFFCIFVPGVWGLVESVGTSENNLVSFQWKIKYQAFFNKTKVYCNGESRNKNIG